MRRTVDEIPEKMFAIVTVKGIIFCLFNACWTLHSSYLVALLHLKAVLGWSAYKALERMKTQFANRLSRDTLRGDTPSDTMHNTRDCFSNETWNVIGLQNWRLTNPAKRIIVGIDLLFQLIYQSVLLGFRRTLNGIVLFFPELKGKEELQWGIRLVFFCKKGNIRRYFLQGLHLVQPAEKMGSA